MNSEAPLQPLPRIMTSDQILPTMQAVVAELRSVRDHVAHNIQPTDAYFTNTIKPLIDVENSTQGEVGVIAMLRYAAPEEATREASEEACKLWRDCDAEFKAREDLYLIVRAVKDKSEPLHFEAAKYLETLLLDFKRSGLGVLDSDQIQQYIQTQRHIKDLERQYNQNLRDEVGAVEFRLEQLQGITQSSLDRFPGQDLRQVSFRSEDVQAVLKYAHNPDTRKTMWVAGRKKAPQNVDIFKKTIILRDTNARLLGYASHAAFKQEKKVAKTPDRVLALLDSLEEVLVPQGHVEMNDLLALRRAHIGAGQVNTVDPMPPWDYGYYTRLAEENLGLSQEEISEYFPLTYTVSAMMDIFSEFLQLRFEKISHFPEKSRWHEDVMAWSVWDERTGSKDAFVGYIYADLLSRPNKYRGNQNVNLQCVCHGRAWLCHSCQTQGIC